MDYDEEPPFEISRYRDMQKALPGVDALYRLMLAQLETGMSKGGHVFVVGAGGGREVEALCNSQTSFQLTGVDPSSDMLGIAKWYADQSARPNDVRLVQGTSADIKPPSDGFDAATSLLVMHFLPDNDGEDGKKAYLHAIRERLKPDALLIHADISFECDADIAAFKPVFLRHAIQAGLDEGDMRAGIDGIASLPIISPGRTGELFSETGFADPQLFFKSLWYHAWVARAG